MIAFKIYIFLVFFAALALAMKTERKMLSFLLIFWLFSQPILNSVLMIHTPGLGFDLHPNRVMLALLIPYILFIKPSPGAIISRPGFEKYIYLYLIIVFISLAYNFDVIRKQHLGAVPLEILMFVIFYTIAKRYATAAFLEALIRGIILMAIINALISYIQVGIDSTFLKTCEPRMAFGHVVRSSGIFQTEYELGYFQILAVMITIHKFKGSVWRFPLILLFVGSLLTTFHRLDILILMTCVITYIWFFGKASQKALSYGSMFFALLVALVFFKIIEGDINNTEFVKERLKQDTVSGRFEQYKLILQSIANFFWVGMGDYTNKDYFKFMEKAGMVYTVNANTEAWHRVPYTVHNGYLEVCALYGAFAMTTFITFLYTMLKYLKKFVTTGLPYAMAPFFALLIWMLANISNGVSQFGLYFVLLMGLLAGSMISMQRIASSNNVEKHIPYKNYLL